MTNKLTGSRVMYGADYNPEQWPIEIIERDIVLMKEAGVNAVTINVFGWGMIQPSEDIYDFGKLDRVFDLLERNGIDVVLATPTAAPPSWMFQNDPTMLKVNEDGQRVAHWSRQAYCPNHPSYRREIRNIAKVLAERYGKRTNLSLWHINNECILQCYCEYCAEAFRVWLREKYGTLERLNESWQLWQWSLAKSDWKQIMPPIGGMSHTSVSLDYKRFLSDSNLQGFLAEKEEIARITPDIPITTNFYSIDFLGQIHHEWAPHLDVIAWDSYPPHKDYAVWAAFQHDYFRGLKNAPFLLMEQASSNVNWKPYNPAKRPGMMSLQSYQAVARGAEAIMYFQLRQSRGGVEKYHSSLVSHGTESDNRIFREIKKLGHELEKLDNVLRTRIEAKVAILFDISLMWLVEWNKTSRDIDYRDTVTAFYRPLYEANIPVDVVHPGSDLSGYDVVIAPMLYMFEKGVPDNLRAFAERGGKLVMSYNSGMTNECDVVEYGGFLRPIDDVFGIIVEEVDALEPDMCNRIERSDGSRYRTDKWGEVVRLNGAEAIAVFLDDYYAGQPAITRNRYRQGEAYYVATHPEDKFIRELLLGICSEAGVSPLCPNAPEGVEITVREDEGRRFLFMLNHNPVSIEMDVRGDRDWAEGIAWQDLLRGENVEGRITLAAYETVILEATAPR
ncbi:beta-galactosidase [Cohnella endophytica]|uniref:Beta-galactosidase n=1 Tax=Cohnella endophytica TaxID=2419778 RepID=A0A494XQM0_9BACL|nr:beta-galactosidase [Cohnella endophytica]RKP52940.1 beta-galactosidase [Cohnella endophytica]